MVQKVFTIGHSTHAIRDFLAILNKHDIQVVVDVRSSPYSKMNPQFNRERFSESLKTDGIRYLYMGKELGARSEDPSCYDGDSVNYDLLAATELFRVGLGRIQQGAMEYSIALTCAEKDPVQCHRAILVSRHLVVSGIEVQHILSDGSLERHEEMMDRLMDVLNIQKSDFFKSADEFESDAYRQQSLKIAYRRPPDMEMADKGADR